MPCIGLLYWGVFLSLPCVLCALCVVCLVWPVVGLYARLYIMALCYDLVLLACVLVLCHCLLGIFY